MADGLLNNRQGEILLKLARQTLEQKFKKEKLLFVPDEPALSVKAAAFVTLKIDGKLRGCIGNLEPVGALWEGIRDNAINAAFNDHRFSPLTPEELSVVQLDISVLSQPKPLEHQGAEDLCEETAAGNRRSYPKRWTPRCHFFTSGLATASNNGTIFGPSLS